MFVKLKALNNYCSKMIATLLINIVILFQLQNANLNPHKNK
ncbi:hypothetical protein PH505_bn00120 [Pseudoalteromonas distincta]|nr:hypothetical protein PH505_bn00120 [Pseudoalteromonas distincta]